MRSYKKMIMVKFLTIVLLLSIGLFGYHGKAAASNYNAIAPAGMEIVAQNEQYVLFFDMDTTRFAILEQKTQRFLYGTPPDFRQDPIANRRYRDRMSSNLLLTFIDSTGEKTLSSFTNAVDYGQFDVERIQNGVRIEYLMSEAFIDEYAIPLVLPYSFLHERLLPHLTADESLELRQNYNVISVQDDIIHNFIKRHRIKMYPFIVEEDVYVFVPARRSALNREIVRGLMHKAGISDEDIYELNQKYYDHTSIERQPAFLVTLELTIDEDGLLAVVDMGAIEYDSFDAELRSIVLLPYFGAAQRNEEGYILIPDGSGAIMRFEHERPMYAPVLLPVYGGHLLDASVSRPVRQPVCMGAYGIAYADTGFAAVIEQGDAIARIQAGLAGINTNYHYVHTQFLYNDYEMLVNPMNLTRSPLVSNHPYLGMATMRYMFLDPEQADYSGIAAKVRAYYEKLGVLNQIRETDSASVSIEIPGATPVTKRFLGVTYSGYEALTTLYEMKAIVDALEQANISDVQFRLTGWAQGGLDQKHVQSPQIHRVLGRRSALEDFLDKAAERNIEIFPSLRFTRVYTSIFSALFRAVRDLQNSPRSIYEHDSVTQSADTTRPISYLLRPSLWLKNVYTTWQRIVRQGFTNVCVEELGFFLYWDNRSDGTHRQGSLDMAMESIRAIDNDEARIMANIGNIRVADAVDILMDVPLSGSNYIAATESVPFYQMVISGYVDYYGTAVNWSNDARDHVLRSIEYGASGIQYVLSGSDNTTVWLLENNTYRNTLYTDYVEEIAMYSEWINRFSHAIDGARPVRHRMEQPDVYSMLYDNGMITIVNYGYREASVDGHIVPERSFIVVKR